MGNLKFQAEPTPEQFRGLPIYERWAIARGMAATLNQIMDHVEDFGDLSRAVRLAIDYDVSLRARDGHELVDKVVLPAWTERSLNWIDGLELGLDPEQWPEVQWYPPGSTDLGAAVSVRKFGEYLEFV